MHAGKLAVTMVMQRRKHNVNNAGMPPKAELSAYTLLSDHESHSHKIACGALTNGTLLSAYESSNSICSTESGYTPQLISLMIPL